MEQVKQCAQDYVVIASDPRTNFSILEIDTEMFTIDLTCALHSLVVHFAGIDMQCIDVRGLSDLWSSMTISKTKKLSLLY